MRYYTLISFILFISPVHSQMPYPALAGYWHNWDDANAPYIQLDLVDSRYNVIDIAFAVPHSGTDYQMELIPDQVSPAVLLSQIQTLQSQGRKVILSVGGASAPVSLDTQAERDTFINTMGVLLDAYNFDGMDIDLEGSSVTVSGGTISSPADIKIIHLIDAIRQIMDNYRISHNRKLLLTMAPETAFVQGGMSSFGGIWGAYLPVIHALRDSIDLLHVQLYNSGSMYGIDGNIYTSGTADFIVAMCEAVIQGFNTSGGFFAGLPSHKIAAGLPACVNAAGSGFTDTATVRAAIDYLRGTGPQPGTYVLAQPSGYPDLGGMMTWSVNWDAVSTCGGVYEYAENFENIFGTTTLIPENAGAMHPISVYPNPCSGPVRIHLTEVNTNESLSLYNSFGEIVLTQNVTGKDYEMNLSDLASGVYLVRTIKQSARIVVSRDTK